MFNNKPKEIPYDKTEEYLKRQQNIDAILVLTKVLEHAAVIDADQVNRTRMKIADLTAKL